VPVTRSLRYYDLAGSSFLIAHVLHNPPPRCKQLFNRYCSNKQQKYPKSHDDHPNRKIRICQWLWAYWLPINFECVCVCACAWHSLEHNITQQGYHPLDPFGRSPRRSPCCSFWFFLSTRICAGLVSCVPRFYHFINTNTKKIKIK
jgi:hypothetical protein